MTRVEQGDLIRLSSGKVPFLVVSSDFFNQSQLIVVCPVVASAVPDALHIPISASRLNGIALCEQLASVSIARKGSTLVDHLPAAQLMDIIYRVQSIFDYFPHAE